MTNYRRRPKYTGKPQAVTYLINEAVRFPQVRVIDAEGEMIGIMSSKQAMDLAYEQSLDLILINGKIEPQVCRIMDFSKFKYQQSKLEAAKPNNTDKEKMLRLSVRIAANDLLMNARKADEFMLKKNKVKIQIRMRGRERSHPQLALEVMNQFLEMLEQRYDFVSEPKLVGDSNMCTIKLAKV
jgi:translation initiation factor IF-3